jgi:hypothetical protein
LGSEQNVSGLESGRTNPGGTSICPAPCGS